MWGHYSHLWWHELALVIHNYNVYFTVYTSLCILYNFEFFEIQRFFYPRNGLIWFERHWQVFSRWQTVVSPTNFKSLYLWSYINVFDVSNTVKEDPVKIQMTMEQIYDYSGSPLVSVVGLYVEFPSKSSILMHLSSSFVMWFKYTKRCCALLYL